MKKLLILSGVTVAALAAFFWFAPAVWFSLPLPGAAQVHVVIPSGVNADQVADILVEKKLVDSKFKYLLYARLNRAAQQPKAGEYDFLHGTSYAQLVRILARGPTRQELTMRIIEGWIITDVEELLKKAGVDVRLSDFLAERFEQEFEFLRGLPKGTTLEGYLFPDTYRVWADELPDGLLRRQLQEFQLKTVEFAEPAKEQQRSFGDVVILASIIEKEAQHDEDRAIIAGIFMNRLKIGMALQSDATLNYVIQSGRSRLTNEELKNESPYNTYKYRGLPPGPICNPGQASLEAALHPAATDYWYFLTDAEGKAYFARTLEEHGRNRIKAFGY
jgi:UPF0755 protein